MLTKQHAISTDHFQVKSKFARLKSSFPSLGTESKASECLLTQTSISLAAWQQIGGTMRLVWAPPVVYLALQTCWLRSVDSKAMFQSLPWGLVHEVMALKSILVCGVACEGQGWNFRVIKVLNYLNLGSKPHFAKNEGT